MVIYQRRYPAITYSQLSERSIYFALFYLMINNLYLLIDFYYVAEFDLVEF
ncbi:hypothetical protein FVIR_GE00376 [Candidatus Gullanella endobia]|uniref:Uncharacterized protein n=1 Tax=Candidatus Gullanella endobia TaxID=1070130 RepID=A0A143WRJ6_9ENTR|nr:hypothetical protein FVIR_GE00376 [Candidatus Gullanella endobia]